MTDRLRRLDALFATRVLGHDPAIVAALALGPPRYTRSLDAAWPGVEAVLQKTNYRDFDFMYKYWSLYEARFCVNKNEHPEMDTCRVGLNEGHPAEALVLACLRAVGVDEKDLA